MPDDLQGKVAAFTPSVLTLCLQSQVSGLTKNIFITQLNKLYTITRIYKKVFSEYNEITLQRKNCIINLQYYVYKQ